MRRRIYFLVTALFLVSFFSCETIEDLLTFKITDSTTFTIENSYGIDIPFSVPTPDITTNSSQEFENNDTRSDLVETIKLKKLELTIQSPDDFTFSFLKSLEIYISANGVEEIQIAYKDNIPRDVSSIELETTDNDLSAYIKKDTYELKVKAVTREAFARDVTIKADMEYQVKADPL